MEFLKNGTKRYQLNIIVIHCHYIYSVYRSQSGVIVLIDGFLFLTERRKDYDHNVITQETLHSLKCLLAWQSRDN